MKWEIDNDKTISIVWCKQYTGTDPSSYKQPQSSHFSFVKGTRVQFTPLSCKLSS